MKSINAKRIAAVAASLLVGLAFAGSGGVTWSNIPIVNNQGQPVVQVVVGSQAQPSDGVVAANIAAVLGNLAFTSVNVTATPTGLSNVKCVVTTPSCTLSNQQVWFNERGFTGPTGSYGFTALIGSVLNQGIPLGAPSQTKAAASTSSYAFPTYGASLSSPLQVPTQTSPSASPFAVLSSPPNPTQTASPSNAGGLSFSTIRSSAYDNLLQVTSSQLPSLLSNFGPNGEGETLWLSGIPVYDQKSGTNPSTPNFAVFDAGGAYQVTFNKPIQEPFNTGTLATPIIGTNSINNAALQLLGQNWTILSYKQPSGTPNAATNAVVGGSLSLAASLTQYKTVYVGHNITSNNFTVQLTDLGQPANGISPAAVDVFYAGNLTNVTQLSPHTITKFSFQKHNVYVNVNQTFAGLYAYQKWAKMKLYSNVVNFTSGQVFNTTNAPGWRSLMLWTNASGTVGGLANQLQSIILYNVTPTALTPGGSFSFVSPNYTAYKVNFVGDSLGTNYDPVQFSTTAANGGTMFKNYGTQPSAGNGALTYISEPYQQLTATSQISSAFSYGGQVSSTLNYDLTPYNLNFVANAFTVNGAVGSPIGFSLPVNVVVNSIIGDANIITSTNYITVQLQGYATQGASSPSTATVYVKSMAGGGNIINPGTSSGSAVWSGATSFYNITNVTLSSALPDLSVNVIASNSVSLFSTSNILVSLTTATPQLMYKTSGNNYFQLTTTPTVTYSQQNGQTAPTGGFQINTATAPNPVTATMNPYFTYNVIEYDVPGYTSSNDVLQFGIYNNTNGGGSSFGFALNRTVGQNRNNMTYYSSQVVAGTGGSSVAAPVGFVTERGSKVAAISPSSVTINYAKAVDLLQFVVSPSATVVNSTSGTKSVGPVGVGQAVPGFSNLTVSNVTATCGGVSVKTSTCTVSGLANVTATPSVTQAVVPVSLNTATTPLVVLDSNANSAATLVLVGSKFVNSVSAQVFAQNPSLNSSFNTGSVVVQAYGTNRILVAGYTANQTVQAGNQFINDLLQAAAVK